MNIFSAKTLVTLSLAAGLVGVGVVSAAVTSPRQEVRTAAVTDFQLYIGGGDLNSTLPFNTDVIKKSDGSVNGGATVTFYVTKPDAFVLNFTQRTDGEGRIRGQLFKTVTNLQGTYSVTAAVNGGSSASTTFDIRERAQLTRNNQTFTGQNQLFKNSADSATAFQVQNAAGTPQLTVDTINGKVIVTNLEASGIITGNGSGLSNVNASTLSGQTGSYYTNASNIGSGTLDDARLSGKITAAGNDFNGAGQLVQLGSDGKLTTLDGSNLINVTASGYSGSVTDSQLSANAALLNRDSQTFTGNQAAFRNATNSNTAFQVQDSAGSTVLGVDTQNARVTVSNLSDCDSVYTDATKSLTCNLGFSDHIGKIQVHGHSYTTAGNSAGPPATFDNYTNRLATMLHANLDNGGQGGAVASWPNGQPVNGNGGFFKVLQDVTVPKTSAPYVANSPAGILNYGMNDMAALGPANFDAPFKNAMRTMVSRYRTGGLFEAETNPGGRITFSGTDWTNVPNTYSIASGTGYRTSSTENATYAISVPADFPGGTVAVGVVFNSVNPATHTFTVDGSAAGNASSVGQYSAGKSIVYTKRFTGLSPGAHTIVGTINGGSAVVDFWQIEADKPPVTLLPLANRAFGYGVYGTGTPNPPWSYIPSDSDIPQVNNAITSVADEFDNRVITVETDSAINKQQSMFWPDQIHLNEAGNAKYAAAMYKALRAAPLTIDDVANGSVNLNTDNRSNVVFRNGGYNSANAFQVQNYGGPGVANSVIFNVDTANRRVGIGTATPTKTLEVSGEALFKTPANAVTALQVQNSSGTSVLDVDTANQRVGIGTGAPAFKLDVQGAGNNGINVQSGDAAQYAGLFVGRTAAFEGIFAVAAVSNQFLSGATAGDAVLRANVGALRLGSSSSAPSTIVRNENNSTTAFQVQSSTGASLFTVNTTNSQLTFGANTVAFSSNVRGINQAIANGASSVAVTFGTAHADANYAVQCTPSYNTNCYVTGKTATGFTINFGTAAPDANQKVDWFVVR